MSSAESESGKTKTSPWVLVAMVLAALVLGGIGGFAVAAALDDDGQTADLSPVAALARFSTDPTPGDGGGSTTTPTTTADTETTGTETSGTVTPAPGDGDGAESAGLSKSELALIARLPGDEQTDCSPFAPPDLPHGLDPTAVDCTAPNGVATRYQQFGGGSRTSIRVYRDVLAELGVEEGSGVEPCPVGIPSEQSWIANGVTLGRYACIQGSQFAVLLWTHSPTATVAIARAPESLAMTDLYAWWSEQARPLLSTNELEFYERIPEDHRDTCEFTYVQFNPVAAVPPPESGSDASCSVAVEPDPSGAKRTFDVSYLQNFSAERQNAAYTQFLEATGVQKESGTCPGTLPSEEPWTRNGTSLGRLACADLKELSGIHIMLWTTEPLLITGFALALPSLSSNTIGVTMVEMHEWWTEHAGPVYSP